MALSNSTPKIKDPSAILDYEISWSQWLASGETLADSTWDLDAGLTEVQSAFTSTKANIRISGGTANLNYTVTNTITTNTGEVNSQSFLLEVRET